MASQVQQPFLCNNPKSEDWILFKRQFDNFIIIIDAVGAKRLPILLNCIGRDGYTIYDGLADPKTSYEDAVARFDEYFKTRSSLLLRRKQFFEAKQGPHEPVIEYSCRLRRLMTQCDFNAATSLILLRDIFVCGIYSNMLGERLLSEDAATLTFENAIARAEAWERARSDRQTVGSSQVARITSAIKPRRNCFRCNSAQHLATSPQCPARNAKCRKCTKVGHYAIVCKAKMSNAATEVSSITIPTSSKEEEVMVYATDAKPLETTRTVLINGEKVKILIDTGAQVNVLPENVVHDLELRPTAVTLSTWGQFPLTVLGETVCQVTYGNVTVETVFIVVKLHNKGSLPLFSTDLCRQLKLLNELVSSIELNDSACMNVVDYFESKGIFDGIGLLKNYTCKVTVDESVKPVSCPPVKLPPAILQEVESDLQRLSEEGIIRKIEEPTDWCSRLVVAKKRDGSIRICNDLRALNKALKRPVFQMPDPSDIFAQIGSAKVYSLLDCKSAFHQIALDPQSQLYFTFAAPTGRYVWQRMPMGAKIAPEVFQRALSDILAGIPRAFVYYDDILLAAENTEEHSKLLRRVLQTLHDNGITLNKDKCIFAKDSVEFLGHSL